MLIAFSVTPVGTATASVGEIVAEAVRIVRDSGLPNRTDAMFTTIEGEWDEVMAVVKASTLAVAEHTGRASVVIKVDYRAGISGAMDAKVQSIEEHLTSS